MESLCAAAAAAQMPLYPPALLSLPDMDRPPALMTTWELEAVAAALPAKKRRLRETFERLAACSPAPLPVRWEDLDEYISSMQYSVTLRFRQLRDIEKARIPPAALDDCALAATGGDVAVTGKKRKAADEAIGFHQAAQEDTRMVGENAPAANKTCLLQVIDGTGKRLIPAGNGGQKVKDIQMHETVNEMRKAEGNRSDKVGDAKLSPFVPPRGDGVGVNGIIACTDVTMQVENNTRKVARIPHDELPATTPHARNFIPGHTGLLVSDAAKEEPAKAAAVVEMRLVKPVEEQTKEVIKEEAQAAAAKKASPLRVKVSPVHVSCGSDLFAEAVASADTLLAKSPSTSNHVLQKQHMANKMHSEPNSLAEKDVKMLAQNQGSSRTGSQHVLETQVVAHQQFNSKPEIPEGSRGLQGNGSTNVDDGNGKGKPQSQKKKKPIYCKRCGSVDHPTNMCRTANHLVALYQKDKKEREANQICYRCGCKGHWSRICKVPKHLADLYKKDREAKMALLQTCDMKHEGSRTSG